MRRTSLGVTTTALGVIAVVLGFATPASAASPVTVRSSTHLAGYARSHAPGFTGDENVNATFRVPRIDCTSLPASGGAVTIWAGVDGVLAGSTVSLRAGVQISCPTNHAIGAYSIVWSQSPNVWKALHSTAPGHKIYVFVSSASFQPVNVSDETTGELYSGGTGHYPTDLSSVECMVDSVGRADTTVAQPDFGAVVFSSCNDFSTSSRYRPIADPTSASPGETTYRFQNRTGAVRSTTSPWRSDHTWAVTWVATGP